MINEVSRTQYPVLNKKLGRILGETKLDQMSFSPIESTYYLDPD
jgi:hypothetical protein